MAKTKEEQNIDNAQVAATIEVLAEAIYAIDESGAAQSYAVKEKIVAKIGNLIDKIE